MRLIDAVRIAAGKKDQPTETGLSRGFFEQGTVLSVDGMGVLTVDIGGRVVAAKPATDEPFRVNMLVWVSETTEGYIAHGGKR